MVRALELMIIFSGFFIVYLAFNGYRRINNNSLLYLGIGFSLLTIGSIIEGVLYELLTIDLLKAHLIEALFQLGGFIFVIYSIYSR